MRQRYRKKADQFVIAVQLNLDTAGLHYRKWGGEQHAKQGDWLVDNNGDVYTVEQASFAKTYKQLSAGTYLKITPVWAEKTLVSGSVQTKEGHSHYVAGDYLVSNNEDGSDAYCIGATQFNAMYERDQ